ncbi:CXXC-type zinc finger protein 1 [Drosophila suzukii]|uniref:CXXC-type zinc finger protein 1 n=1 Tax=Drosophila suzukii TaxID=28584 RepID=A0AB39ZCZ1_DROSZ
MPAVYKRLIKEPSEDPSPEESNMIFYCICGGSHKEEFMISCDNCNVWFHGCIGISKEQGDRYDKYYCDSCRLKNPQLKPTFHSDPPGPTTPAPKTEAPIIKIPKIRILESTKRQPPFRKSSSKKPKTSAKVQKKWEPTRLEPEEKVEEKPANAKKIDPVPVEKSYVSMGTQCDLIRELVEQTSNSLGNPLKDRGICYNFCCTQIARPQSRYCSDECGTFKALTDAFSVLPPNNGSDGFKTKDLMVQSNLHSKSQLEKNNSSTKNSQPTEPEKKSENKSDTKSRRKSRYHSPSKSTSHNSSVKKPKLEEKPASSESSADSKKESANTPQARKPPKRRSTILISPIIMKPKPVKSRKGRKDGTQ